MISMKLGVNHWRIKSIILCSNDDRQLTLSYFTASKNIIMSSFKSSGDIQKKEDGPDSCFG